MRPELRNRLIFGVTIAGLMIGGLAHDLLRGGHLAVIAVGVLALIAAAVEYIRLARAHAVHAQLAPLVVIGVALVLVPHLLTPQAVEPLVPPDQLYPSKHNPFARQYIATAQGLPLVPLLLGLGLLWTVLAQMFRHAIDGFFANVGATLLGMIYLGVSLNLLQHLALIEAPGNPGRGTQLLMIFLGTAKLGDVTAYFGGRAFGRNKMSPRISPGKTWEGFAFSFVGAVGGAYVFSWLAGVICAQPPFDAWWKPLIWGLVLGPLGVAGDLAESAMKRDAAVKDSGAAVPGFGGVLDILDAVIIAAPVAFLLALVL